MLIQGCEDFDAPSVNVRKIMIEDEETKANNGRRFDDACADEPDAKKTS